MNPASRTILQRWSVLAPLLLPSLVSAQLPSDTPPSGMWWEVSAAAGGARLTCLVCDRTRELGPALGAAIGAYASPRLRVGLEGGAWSAAQGDARETVYRVGLVAQLHPDRGSGLHLVGGLGWSGYRLDETTYDGVHVTLGGGWDLPLIGGWVVGNRLTVDAASHAALKHAGTKIESPVGLSVMRFGVYLRRR